MTGAAALLAALALDLALLQPALEPPRQAALQSIADEITVTATRTPARLGDTAASVTVLSAEELAATAAPALDDALRQVPGFSLFRRSGSRFANPTAQGASLRGLGGSGASRALVLDDGVPLNDPFGGWIYWGRVPRAALARVEVLRGGASDLYGSTALAGVVQLVRREAAPQVRGEAAWGELGSAEGSLFWAGRGAAWGASLAAGAAETDGYVLVAPRERGPVDTPAGSRYATGDLTLERAPAGGGRLFVRASAFDESRRNGTPLQTNATRLFQGSVGGDWGLGRGLLAARAWAGEQDFEQTFTAVAADRGSERLTRAQEVPAETAGGNLQWTQPAGARQTLVAGIELRDVEGTSDETAFTAAGSVRAAAGGQQRTAGLFAEDLLRLSERLSLALAARWDRWENDGTGGARAEAAFSPRASLLYRAGERWALTAAAYRGFRAPTLNELYRAFRVGDVVTLANPALAAERSAGAEVGALLTAAGGRLTARGTLFWMEVDRTIANVTLAVEPGLITRRRENLGRSRSRGVEAGLGGAAGRALDARRRVAAGRRAGDELPGEPRPRGAAAAAGAAAAGLAGAPPGRPARHARPSGALGGRAVRRRPEPPAARELRDRGSPRRPPARPRLRRLRRGREPLRRARRGGPHARPHARPAAPPALRPPLRPPAGLRGASAHGVEVGGEVAGVALADPQVGHVRAGSDALRMLDPEHEVLGRVGEPPGEMGAAAEAVERRPDDAAGTAHTLQGVAAAATVDAHQLAAACGLAAGPPARLGDDVTLPAAGRGQGRERQEGGGPRGEPPRAAGDHPAAPPPRPSRPPSRRRSASSSPTPARRASRR